MNCLMLMLMLILIVWLACGWLGFGFINGYFVTRFGGNHGYDTFVLVFHLIGGLIALVSATIVCLLWKDEIGGWPKPIFIPK